MLPRGLLAELGLARILLGSSGGGQFLLVLPGEARTRAEELLRAAARQVEQMTGERLLLIWTVTENLGDWSVVRRRLNEGLLRTRGTPLASADAAVFQPFLLTADTGSEPYFRDQAPLLRGTHTVGWSPDAPAIVAPGSGKYTWPVTPNLSARRHHAGPARRAREDGKSAATVATLARRAQGRPVWGVLRGDVDNFGVRLRRLTTIEEHVQLSVLYKQFFAGELEVLCSLPEFWRKVTIIYSGGDDFAVYGAWDALILLAREIQRLFHRFTEENLKDFPGAEGKTISMALALAPELQCSARRGLSARPAGTWSWRSPPTRIASTCWAACWNGSSLAEAAELKETRDAADGRAPLLAAPSCSNCAASTQGRRRFGRQLGRRGNVNAQRDLALSAPLEPHPGRRPGPRISEAAGPSDRRTWWHAESAEVKLRPAGLVALEWARLATEG